MKFSEFYHRAENDLKGTFISMFDKGKTDYIRHLQWMFDREKFIQPPVFQNIFPWEPSNYTFGDCTDILGNEMVNALSNATFNEPLDENATSEDMSFNRDLKVYQHQRRSWEAVLRRNKSIVVTTGTSSGKTECFTIPILKLLYDVRRNLGSHPGVQAIFLYPLNALMSSQRKRVHAWCNQLAPQVTYAIYNGNTPEAVAEDKRKRARPELIDRESIRKTPPQILFTNPSMLEYMMIRAKDAPIATSSPNLKWIVLDEAHIYTGSAATELALLIRRTLQFFGKTPADVNFAITSATIGNNEQDEQLSNFLQMLTGKPGDSFEIIGGNRILPELDNDSVRESINSINNDLHLNIRPEDIEKLRNNLFCNNFLDLDTICNSLHYHPADNSIEEQLKLIDRLSEKGSARIDGSNNALLPVRAHFFGRTIQGLFACTNPNCSRYQENHINIGSLTSRLSLTCPECGGVLLDVHRCDSCGEFLLTGERENRNIDGDRDAFRYHMKDHTLKLQELTDDNDNPFNEDEEDQENNDINHDAHNVSFLLSEHKEHKIDTPFQGAQRSSVGLDSMGGGNNDGVYHKGEENYTSCTYRDDHNHTQVLCPECGEKSHNCTRMTMSATFESRKLVHPVLDQCTPSDDANVICEGRKYITFTDNRQGTAKIAHQMLIDNEREYTRSLILYLLINDTNNHDDEIARLENENNQLINFINQGPILPAAALALQAKINENNITIASLRAPVKKSYNDFQTKYKNYIDNEIAPSSSLCALYTNLCNRMKDDNAMDNENEHETNNINNIHNINQDDYLKAEFLNHLAMRPIHGNSLETLGLIQFEYPALDNIDPPAIFTEFYNLQNDFDTAKQEWNSFLHIAIDYLRRNAHFIVPQEVKKLISTHCYSKPIFAPTLDRYRVKRVFDDIPLGAEVYRAINNHHNNNEDNENDSQSHSYISRWPQLPADANEHPQRRISKLPLLLLLGRNIHTKEQLNDEVITYVNCILRAAWDTLKDNGILKNTSTLQTDDGDYIGYRLDLLSDSAKISLARRITICPSTHQCIARVFRGISPMVKGVLSETTYRRYRIQNDFVDVPQCPIHWEIQSEDNNGRIINEDTNNERRAQIEQEFLPQITDVFNKLGADTQVIRDLFLRQSIFIPTEHSAQISGNVLRHKEELFKQGKINVMNCSTTMEMGIDISGISCVVMHNVPPKAANYQQRVGRAGRRNETQALAYTICNGTAISEQVFQSPGIMMSSDYVARPNMNLQSRPIVQRHINGYLLGCYCRSLNIVTARDKVGCFIEIPWIDDPGNQQENSCTYNGFLDYIHHTMSQEERNYLTEIIRGTVLETESIDTLINNTREAIECCLGPASAFRKEIEGLNSFYDRLMKERNHQRQCNYIKYRHNSLLNENLIGKLAELGFLPAASIPTNIVTLSVPSYEIDNHRATNDEYEYSKKYKKIIEKTSRSKEIAIQEYAPGRDVVIDNWAYTVLGINRTTEFNNNPLNELSISVCQNCGYVYQGSEPQCTCPHCNSEMHSVYENIGRRYTAAIEPITGFVAGERHQDEREHTKYYTTPALLNMSRWYELDEDVNNHNNRDNNINNYDYKIRSSEPDSGRILFWNSGTGYGFAHCPYCGRMAAETGLQETGLQIKEEPCPIPQNHKDPFTGLNCDHNDAAAAPIRRNVLLSATHHTNICELFIPYTGQNHDKLLYTLGTLISREFAKYMGIEESEIAFGVTNQGRRNATLFIYDTAAGGAGYSNQLERYIDIVFDRCREAVTRCDCRLACTNCLIDRNSQLYIDKLDRNIALNWLNTEYNNRGIVPDELQNIADADDIKKIHCLTHEILEALNNRDMNFVFFLSNEDLQNDINADSLFNSHRESIRRRDPQKTRLVVPPGIDQGIYTQLSLFTLQAQFGSLQQLQQDLPQEFKPLFGLTHDSADYDDIFFVSFHNNIYKVTNPNRISLADHPLTLHDVFRAETIIAKGVTIESHDLLRTIVNDTHLNDIETFLTNNNFNRNVTVKCMDKYLVQPIGCILIAQLLKQLKDRFQFTYEQLVFSISEPATQNEINGLPEERLWANQDGRLYLTSNFKFATSSDKFINNKQFHCIGRDNFLQTCIEQNIGLTNPTISNDNIDHHRPITISSDEFEIIIRPDGGIGRGWKINQNDPNSRDMRIDDLHDNYRQSLSMKTDKNLLFNIAWRRIHNNQLA